MSKSDICYGHFYICNFYVYYWLSCTLVLDVTTIIAGVSACFIHALSAQPFRSL